MSRPFLDRETTVRALSGIAFVLVVLGAAQLGVWTQLILWTAVGTGAWFEWRKHTPQASWISKLGRVVLFGSLAGMMWFLPQMNGSVYDPQRVFLFLGLVWTNDTLAYVFGRLLGRRKLMPSVSPGKTWEGFLGGVLSASGFAWIWTGYWEMSLLGGLTGVLATAGDLTESAWKRRRGLKDSGQMLPGHGGVLDRFDGFLYALPVFTLWMWISGHFF